MNLNQLKEEKKELETNISILLQKFISKHGQCNIEIISKYIDVSTPISDGKIFESVEIKLTI